MSYTTPEQQSLDTIRTSCVDLFTFIVYNMEVYIHNWKQVSNKRDHGTTPVLKRTKRYPGEPIPSPQAAAAARPEKTKPTATLPWLGSTIGKIISLTFLDAKPHWTSFNPPPTASDEDTTDYDRLRKINGNWVGITNRFIISLNELIEKIRTDDLALLNCYQHLKRISHSLRRNEWKLLLRVFEANDVTARVNIAELDEDTATLDKLPLYLKKTVRQFPPVADFSALYKKVRQQGTAEP